MTTKRTQPRKVEHDQPHEEERTEPRDYPEADHGSQNRPEAPDEPGDEPWFPQEKKDDQSQR